MKIAIEFLEYKLKNALKLKKDFKKSADKISGDDELGMKERLCRWAEQQTGEIKSFRKALKLLKK